jgi:L,D-peptidoglycan transpeptidase YkuD (ErfK/YbiS/YcfS/YnhG family)
MGWCDAPGDRRYNRLVRLPYAASHEKLWRDDHLYDVVIVTDHNLRPTLRGGGSAIFFHVREPKGGPTGGCIAVDLADMRKLLPHIGRKTRLVVH